MLYAITNGNIHHCTQLADDAVSITHSTQNEKRQTSSACLTTSVPKQPRRHMLLSTYAALEAFIDKLRDKLMENSLAQKLGNYYQETSGDHTTSRNTGN